MTTNATSHEDGLSFGVELEFLFYFQVPRYLDYELQDAEEDEDPVGPEEITLSPEEEARLPPALVLPADIEYYPEDQEPDHIKEKDTARYWATNLITEAILSVPGAKMEGQPWPEGTPESCRSMYITRDDWDDHSGWTVKNDSSVKEENLIVRGYEYLGFEVTTPALFDRPESHQHVYQVIQELVKRFRLRVNVRTGLHVHVGAGAQLVKERLQEDTPPPSLPSDSPWRPNTPPAVDKDDVCWRKHPLDVFKRAAALMWAADGFLCHAHPPERGLNTYSPPIRFFSRLALGLTRRPVQDPNGPQRWEDIFLETDIPPPTLPTPLLEPSCLPSSTFPRLSPSLFPATRPEAHSPAALARLSDVDKHDLLSNGPVPQHDRLRIRTVHAGVAHIMRCAARRDVAQLLATPGTRRPNYNLTGYMQGGYRAGRVASGTVEFREATGSLAAEWVTTWAGICLGFFRFARDAREERFWAVVERLAEAERMAREGREHAYDVVSLLVDMGLFAEALFLERKLRGDAVGFWYPNRLGKRRAESLEYAEGEYSPPGYWGPGGAPVQDDAVPLSGCESAGGGERACLW